MKSNANSFKGYWFCIFALSLIFCSSVAFGATIRVPDDHQTIQGAIDASTNGDIVLVADGIYKGKGNKNLDFNGKELTVQSENGPTKCIIDCENEGRGFYFNGGEIEDAVVSGFTITNGRAMDQGGGIYCNNSAPTIMNCIIINNTAASSSNNSQGGGIYLGNAGSPTIVNCVIMKNTSDYQGGGMYIYNASPYIINCTITRNIAINGGGLYVKYKPAPIFYNCIFWGNTPNEVKKHPVNTVSPVITYSIVQGGFSGQGNIKDDPLFISFGDYYHLTNESPGIDKGTSKNVPETDIDGDTRPAGKRIDMGADEFVGEEKM